MGYSESAVTSVTITFPEIGEYTFDDLSVACFPMDNYAEHMEALAAVPMTDEKIGTNTVSGVVSPTESGVLCLSVPYSDGWTAYVDGKETTLYNANIKYSAIYLDAGRHEIKLVYHTPFLKVGMLTSAALIFLLLLSHIVYTVLKKKKQAKERQAD